MNCEQVLKDCGIGAYSSQDILKRIAGLEEFYTTNEIIELYDYIITYVNDYEILSGIIKFSDNYKASSTLALLLNLLTSQYKDIDNTDEIINLRVLCAKAIAKYKEHSTVGTLLYCLNNKDENYKVRLACADALGRIGDKYAVKPLINVVQDEDEKSVYVKESATFALGLIGDTSAIEPLIAIMEAKQGIWDKFSFLKEKIIEALGKLNINNKNVLKIFKISLMDSSAMVRINTIEALMNSEYEEAEELIRKSLKDSDEEVQRNALYALYNMIGRDILDEVISLPGYSDTLKEEAEKIIYEYEE